MTVRDKVGRTRYVVFRVADGSPVARGAMQDALPEGVKLTRFDGAFGIARTLHTKRDALVEALRSTTRVGGRPVVLETLATSGTLRAAARALPPEAPASKRGARRGRQG